MAPLWGEFAAVPAAQVRPLVDREVLHVAGRDLQVHFTPGHAWHHVAYWDAGQGAVYTGDVGGVRMPGTTYNCPPTPPPDFDPLAWAESVERLRGLNARRWYLTHFGPVDDVRAHIDQLLPNLDEFIAIGLSALDRGANHDELTSLFHQRMTKRIGSVPGGILTNLEWATPSYMAALGMMRFHKQRTRTG